MTETPPDEASDQAGDQASDQVSDQGAPAPRRARTPQMLKPQTAADKLGVYLPATPAPFQARPISRDELAALEADPPEWLRELRRSGPHPRKVVAARLRVSTSGLARGGLTEALTSEQIEALSADPPEWLVRERATYRQVRAEEERQAERRRDEA